MAQSVKPTQSVASVRARGRLRLSRSQRKQLTFYAFIGPWLLGFLLFGVGPLALGFYLSLTNYNGLNWLSWRFVGAGNYVRAFNDLDMAHAIQRTVLWSLINTPLWLASSFLLAVTMNRHSRGQGTIRTLLYLPSIVPMVATIYAWKMLLDTNFGLVNAVLDAFRPGTAIKWFTDYGFGSLTAISLWTGLGSGVIIFLAGLQGIPTELEEAARIDGATDWQAMRHVTLPLMTPVIFFQLILGLINSFQTLALPLLMSQTGAASTLPLRSVYLYMVHAYAQIFVYQRFGYGLALIWMLFVVVLILTLVVFATSRYWVYYEHDVEGDGR